MSQILNTGMSDYNKEKLYSPKLAKYLTMKKQKNVTPTPLINIPLDKDDLMMSIPKIYRNKVAVLLQYLQSDQDVKWDEQGHLYIEQQKVDNSHILDLLYDTMRLRKKADRPQGWRELSSHLRKRNVPRELIVYTSWYS